MTVSTKRICDDCGTDTGIFYFTGENSLDHAQPCGKCNQLALEIVKKLNNNIKLQKELVKGMLSEYEMLVKQSIGYLHSVENDYNQEVVNEFCDELRAKLALRLITK